jgi:hypothetical protein
MIKSRRVRGEGHVACIWETSKTYKIIVRKPGGRSLGRVWEDNMKTYLREMWCGNNFWISSVTVCQAVQEGCIMEWVCYIVEFSSC